MSDNGQLSLAIAGMTGGTDIAQGYMEGAAANAQARFQASGLKVNAELAEENARDAIARGQAQVMRVSRVAKQIAGAQRAALAGGGVDVSTGSAADIVEETGRLSAEDIKNLQNAAWKEAYGYKFEATELRRKAKETKATGRYIKGTTLATGGIKAARDMLVGYQKFKYPGENKERREY